MVARGFDSRLNDTSRPRESRERFVVAGVSDLRQKLYIGARAETLSSPGYHNCANLFRLALAKSFVNLFAHRADKSIQPFRAVQRDARDVIGFFKDYVLERHTKLIILLALELRLSLFAESAYALAVVFALHEHALSKHFKKPPGLKIARHRMPEKPLGQS